MTRLTLIVQEAPDGPSPKAGDALRLAGAALTEELEVRLFLLGAGVELGRRGRAAPAGGVDPALLAELVECGLEVQACGKCMRDRGLDEDDLVAGVRRGSMRSLVAWIKDSEHVIGF